MSEHTPGPWSVDEDGEIVAPGGEHIVCFGHDYDEYGSYGAREQRGSTGKALYSDRAMRAYEHEVGANRALLAAAPTLEEALRALVEGHDEAMEKYPDEYRGLTIALMDAYKQARALLTPAAAPLHASVPVDEPLHAFVLPTNARAAADGLCDVCLRYEVEHPAAAPPGSEVPDGR